MHVRLFIFISLGLHFVTPLHASQACIKAKTLAEHEQLALALYKTIRLCMFSRTPTMEVFIKQVNKLLEQGAPIIAPVSEDNTQPPIIHILNTSLRVSTPQGAVCITHDEKFGELLDLLLTYGADINTDWHMTPLHRVIGNKAPFKTVQTILDRKAHPHIESLGFTPIMYLAHTYDGDMFHHDRSFHEPKIAASAFKKIMIALLKAGVDINTQNIFGWTALMCLHDDFYHYTIPLLLDANANPYSTSYDETTVTEARKTVKFDSYDFFNRPAKDLADKNFFEIAAIKTARVAKRRKMQAIDPFTLPTVRKAFDNYHGRLETYEEAVVAPAIVEAIKESPMVLDLAIIIARYAGCSMPTTIPND